ncbi:MAG: heparinase II/III family protein [Verrucomicrobiaceae bacterium]|nr:heparinase II/III family protein [Verrucomicrobiaceae bacterium]
MSGSSKLSWYVHRLWAMSLSELWHRVCERQRHRSDATFAQRAQGITLGQAEAFPELPDRTKAPLKLRGRLSVDAKELLAGDWLLYGWKRVSTGAPPCWHRDAACGVIIEPDELSHKLDHRHLPDPADVRTIWEINRWSEMTRVMMHAWLNQDYDAARTAQIWLEDWVERNPVGRGINWTSPLEAALRLMNFAWFDALVHACGQEHLSSRQRVLAERIVPVHALWVHRYRSFGSSANNHLLGELVGLLHAVKRWPSLEADVGSADSLWKEIATCVMNQFAPDGGNREQALHYHLFAWEMAWHACTLMSAHDAHVTERLRRAAEFFVRMVHPLEPWDYGDSDDAQVLPIVLDRGDAMAEWQSWLAGHDHGDTIGYWMGDSPLRNVSLDSSTQPEGWWLAPDTGMAVCELDDWVLRLDASPTGYGKIAAHGHCDALHLSIWDSTQALVIDPGTFGYYGMGDRRADLAAWSAHNGPQPAQGFVTPRRMGTFLLTQHYAKPETARLGDHRMSARLQHEGHDFTRLVDLRSDGTLCVQDQAAGTAAFKVRWTFAPECQVSGGSDLVYQIKRGTKTWHVELCGDDLINVELGETMVSRRYGQLERAVTIEVVAKGELRTEWRRG